MAIRVHSFVRMDRLAMLGMTMPGGETYRWFHRNVEVPALTLADVTTPTRTGRMRAQNYSDMGANQSGLWVQLGNHADYAVYVHEGTDGPIFPSYSHLLALGRQSPTGWGYPPFMYAESVSGQRSQPWLADSAADALRAHGFYATSTAIRLGGDLPG